MSRALREVGVLDQGGAARLADRPQPPAPVAVGAREDDADQRRPVRIGGGLEQDVDRRPANRTGSSLESDSRWSGSTSRW